MQSVNTRSTATSTATASASAQYAVVISKDGQVVSLVGPFASRAHGELYIQVQKEGVARKFGVTFSLHILLTPPARYNNDWIVTKVGPLEITSNAG